MPSITALLSEMETTWSRSDSSMALSVVVLATRTPCKRSRADCMSASRAVRYPIHDITAIEARLTARSSKIIFDWMLRRLKKGMGREGGNG